MNLPNARPPNFCQTNRKSEGFHSNGCNSHFFDCTGGVTQQLDCPAGLFYDREDGACDYKGNVVACGGKKPANSNSPPVQQLNSNTQQQQSQGPSTTTPHPPAHSNEFDCSRRQDGYFSKGCSSRYFACHSGTSQTLQCPGVLKFSQNNTACEYEENVAECGSRANNNGPPAPHAPASRPPPQPRQQPQIGQKGAVEKDTKAFLVPGGNPCQSLVNGIYGRPCNRFYFYCSAHVTYDFACTIGQAFDTQSGKCTEEGNVPSCLSAAFQPDMRRY